MVDIYCHFVILEDIYLSVNKREKTRLNILLIEPYFTGSHASWAQGYQKHSRHQVDILSLPGQFWKWRMHGGAVTLARKFLDNDWHPDLLLVTDMLDVTTFLALTRERTYNLPVALYFHENQLCYPWSPTDRDVQAKRDHHYGFINYSSALTANHCYFNSDFHRCAFLEELHRFLKHFPDYRELPTVETIRAKSTVLPLGLDLRRFDRERPVTVDETALPVLLWNHRWEYDKNPEDFFNVLFTLSDEGASFHLVVLGENFSQSPSIFDEAKRRLASHILQFGFVERPEDYAHWLWTADILPVTSNHDFFGASVIEAVYCGCLPLLPKRLSYPGLFPDSQFPQYYYENLDDLKNRLRNAIGLNFTQKHYVLRKHVSQFDWEDMAPQYDNAFETML